MSFLIYMICVVFAIFAGMVLDRVLIITARENNNNDINVFNIGCDTKEEAELCMRTLNTSIKKQGILRVYDLNIMMNFKTEIGDFKYGWKNLSEFKTEQNGTKWIIRIPDPELIENIS